MMNGSRVRNLFFKNGSNHQRKLVSKRKLTVNVYLMQETKQQHCTTIQSCDVLCTDYITHPCGILPLAQACPKVPCIFTSNEIHNSFTTASMQNHHTLSEILNVSGMIGMQQTLLHALAIVATYYICI